MNSVQLRSFQQADSTSHEIRQWETDNVQVTHWLDGVPEPPLRTPIDPPRPKKRIDVA